MERWPHLIGQRARQHRLPILDHISQLAHRIADGRHPLNADPSLCLYLLPRRMLASLLVNLSRFLGRPVQRDLLHHVPVMPLRRIGCPAEQHPRPFLRFLRPRQVIARARTPQHDRLSPYLDRRLAELLPLHRILSLQLSRPLNTLADFLGKSLHLHTLRC